MILGSRMPHRQCLPSPLACRKTIPGPNVYRAIGLLRKTSKLFPNSGAWDYRIGFASEPFDGVDECFSQ